MVGLLYAAAFVPLTYWIDRTAYRNYLRRRDKAAAEKASPPLSEALVRLARVEMALAGPRGQEDQDPRAVGRRQRMALGRLEPEQAAAAELDGGLARRHLHGAVDDRDPGVLLHLVLARAPGPR